ncbi:MAG: hypothetical protein Q8O37_11775 [Sulfuricellaceae bacterium]|nr:hypothetical protein [Sulfuricellaceae bacterium]
MKILNLTLLSVAAFSAGCATDVPIPAGYPTSYQQKMKSAHHWDVLAQDVAKQTASLLAKNDQLRSRALFVVPPTEAVTFDAVFRQLLISQLVNQGLTVSGQPAGAVEVRYQTKVVHHNSERFAHCQMGSCKTEVVVTTTITSDGLLPMSRSDIHYIEDEDASLFRAPAPDTTKTWGVVGK